jgi:peroxiredoxin
VAQLCQQVPEFGALNTRIILISFGSPDRARIWLDQTNVPFTLLLDPERKAYRAYGLEYSLLRSWGLNVWQRYAELLLKGRKWRGIQGNSGQLGGDVIVDSKGRIRLAYRSHDPTDRPDVQSLLAALR